MVFTALLPKKFTHDVQNVTRSCDTRVACDSNDTSGIVDFIIVCICKS